MRHSLAKLFTILAVLAVAVNAQCAVSCSLAPAPAVKQEAHSCCKDQKVPASHKRQVCPEPILTIASSLQSQEAPDVCVVSIGHRDDAGLGLDGRVRVAAVDLHPIPDIPTFSILRL